MGLDYWQWREETKGIDRIKKDYLYQEFLNIEYHLKRTKELFILNGFLNLKTDENFSKIEEQIQKLKSELE